MAKGKTPEEEMKETWKFFDVDEGGDIDKKELKEGLARVGILLAPWELNEMMEVRSALFYLLVVVTHQLSSEQRSIFIMIFCICCFVWSLCRVLLKTRCADCRRRWRRPYLVLGVCSSVWDWSMA